MSRDTRTLIVLPDDGIEPLLKTIASARESLLVKMFPFSEPKLIEAVIAGHERGVKVRVMPNPARRSGESENGAALKALAAAGVEVKDTHPDFDITHEKSMVVDGKEAFVKSHNWPPRTSARRETML